MKLVPVDPSEFPQFREGRRGRVSYPLLKSFLETGQAICMIDRTGMQQSLQSLLSSLGAYVRNHGLPVKLVTRSGQIYLVRTDVEDNGEVPEAKPIDVYKGEMGAAPVFTAPPPPVTSQEVANRFATEKHKATK